VPARSEYDAYAALFAQEIPRAHHVVDRLDLVVDVLHAGVGAREKRDRMVDFIDTQQRRRAEPVADARVEDARPERLVAHGVRRAQTDVAETGDPGIAGRKIAARTDLRAPHDLHRIAARIGERDEVRHASRFTLGRRTRTHRVAGTLEFGGDRLKIGALGNFERRRVLTGIAFDVTDRMVADVAAEVGHAALATGRLEPEDLGREVRGFAQIGRSDAKVADAAEIDHYAA